MDQDDGKFESRQTWMTPVAFDTETALIGVGRLAPPLTCVSYAYAQTDTGLCWVGRPSCYETVRDWLTDETLILVGLNTAFDLAVVAAEWPDLLPSIFKAYESDRITDIGLRQKLIDIAKGQFRGYTDGMTGVFSKNEYSLAALAERHLKKVRDKETHRMGFGELREIPPENWPKGAAEYAIEDAADTIEIFQLQKPDARLYEDQFRQARAAFGLHLISCWGIKTDAQKIAELEKTAEAAFQAALRLCQENELVRPTGVRDTKKAKARMVQIMEGLQEPTKKTDAFVELRRKRDDDGASLTARELKNLDDPLFGISVDEEACETSGDELLIAYSKVTSLTTIVETHIPALKNGINWPIQPRFEPLVETGRTSCKGHDPKQSTNGYQMHNVRRMPGIRECFTARPGKLYADADFSGLELHTWAQTCLWALGHSRLAEALNARVDPHLILAAQMMGVSYEDAKEKYKAGEERATEARQFAKIGNFGFQGGMAAKTFRAWARQAYRVNFHQTQADFIHASWKLAWPEAEPYFEWIKSQGNNNMSGLATITQFKSCRIRGLIPFTVAANTFFQGLGADATKAALFAIQKECYVDEGSPLFGCRMVNYVHDEFVLEVSEGLQASNASATHLVKVMCEEAAKWLPDVPPRAEVALMKHWSKKAKSVRNKDGLLIPWEMAA
jgi:hypothetical protein